MTTPTLPAASELKFSYLSELPDRIYTRDRRIHYADETDLTLKQVLGEQANDPATGEFDHRKALVKFWNLDGYGWGRGLFQEEGRIVWPCKPNGKLSDAAMLMGVHAPGVAIVDLPPAFSALALARPKGAVATDPRDAPGTADLRLAIAYVCCGHVPPRDLTMKALAAPLPFSVDDAVVEAFELSLRGMPEAEVSEALENLGLAQEMSLTP